jgi:toxin ParE1/3/4
MAKVNLSSEALLDLELINNYITIDSYVYAAKVIDSIYNRAVILETHIRAGRVVPEFNDPAIREIFEGKYRIFTKLRVKAKSQLPGYFIIQDY